MKNSGPQEQVLPFFREDFNVRRQLAPGKGRGYVNKWRKQCMRRIHEKRLCCDSNLKRLLQRLVWHAAATVIDAGLHTRTYSTHSASMDGDAHQGIPRITETDPGGDRLGGCGRACAFFLIIQARQQAGTPACTRDRLRTNGVSTKWAAAKVEIC